MVIRSAGGVKDEEKSRRDCSGSVACAGLIGAMASARLLGAAASLAMDKPHLSIVHDHAIMSGAPPGQVSLDELSLEQLNSVKQQLEEVSHLSSSLRQGRPPPFPQPSTSLTGSPLRRAGTETPHYSVRGSEDGRVKVQGMHGGTRLAHARQPG